MTKNGDAYASGTPEQRWATIARRLDGGVAFANGHGKAKSIDESGLWTSSSNGGGGDNPTYITNMVSYTAAHGFAWWVYFNVPDGGVNTTLAQNPKSLAAYQAGKRARKAAMRAVAEGGTTGKKR